MFLIEYIMSDIVDLMNEVFYCSMSVSWDTSLTIHYLYIHHELVVLVRGTFC